MRDLDAALLHRLGLRIGDSVTGVVIERRLADGTWERLNPLAEHPEVMALVLEALARIILEGSDV